MAQLMKLLLTKYLINNIDQLVREQPIINEVVKVIQDQRYDRCFK